MGLPVLEDEQREKEFHLWRAREEALRKEGVPEDQLEWLSMMTQRNCFGWDSDKGEVIRPGDLGRWDFLNVLMMSGQVDLDVCLRLAGISEDEYEKFQRDIRLEYCGFDPTNPNDVAEAERLDSMTPAELDAEITAFERQLGIKQ